MLHLVDAGARSRRPVARLLRTDPQPRHRAVTWHQHEGAITDGLGLEAERAGDGVVEDAGA